MLAVDDNDAPPVLSAGIRILRLLLRVDSDGSVVKAVVNEMMLLPLNIPLARASMIIGKVVETVMAAC